MPAHRLRPDRDLAAGPVRLGKLATERSVPLDATTLTVLDQWTTRRGAHRPIPHPRTGKPTDFLFTEHGRRLGATRLRNGFLAAVAAGHLREPRGQPMTITPHQLRHTYATALANAPDLTLRKRSLMLYEGLLTA